MQPTQAEPRRRSREMWGNAIGWLLRALDHYWTDRRHHRQLPGLDDRILRDIGITRDMVHHELHKPVHWLL